MFFISLSIILLLAIVGSFLFQKIKLPSIIWFIIIGIVLGPFCLNMIDEGILNISSELRKIALILILIRAGLSLKIDDLKKIGTPAILMCFVPAVIEMIAVGLLAPLFFDISYLDSFIMGSVLGAVSPAVVVPRMIKMIDEGVGVEKGIPQLVMAGASLDDIVVIVIFTSLTTIAMGDSLSVMTFLNVPISIVLGVGSGLIIGLLLVLLFNKIHIRDSIKVIIICGVCFGLYGIESLINEIIGYSGLLASMTIGIVILAKKEVLAKRLSLKYSKLWLVSEIILFVLVGASVNINYLFKSLGYGLILIVIGLIFRSIGVLLSLVRTNINKKEKMFVSIAYLPKATVQAAIGGLPLAMGILGGELILSIAVISIIFTAPIGAFGIDFFQNKLIE